jgi:pimeloyl-[acyl-carrier protein] synthase
LTNITNSNIFVKRISHIGTMVAIVLCISVHADRELQLREMIWIPNVQRTASSTFIRRVWMAEGPHDVRFADAKQLGERLSIELDRLREEAPVYWSENQKAWIITGHAEVTTAFREAKIFSSTSRPQRMLTFLPEDERETRAPYLLGTVQKMIFSLDAPDHPRVKRLMMGAFEKRIIEPYRAEIRRIVDKTLDEALRLGSFDFVPTVAHRIPSHVILTLLGLPDTFLGSLRQWALAVSAAVGGGGTTPAMIDAAEKAALEMRVAFLPEIERRRISPTGDFISTLITARDADGSQLSEEEILANCYLVLLAGHDTTSNTIALSTLFLARDPALWAFFRDEQDPEKILNGAMELSRVIGMSYASARVIAQDHEFAGHHMQAGQLVYLMQGIANRDPSIFAEPQKVDPLRQQRGNMMFGAGVHMCIGHLLAKMQLAEFFPAITRRFGRIELRDKKLDWATSIGFRALASLPVRVHSR